MALVLKPTMALVLKPTLMQEPASIVCNMQGGLFYTPSPYRNRS